jgi:hypothetical protein
LCLDRDDFPKRVQPLLQISGCRAREHRSRRLIDCQNTVRGENVSEQNNTTVLAVNQPRTRSFGQVMRKPNSRPLPPRKHCTWQSTSEYSPRLAVGLLGSGFSER